MRILLTGGTGYIGSAVLDVLVEAGHEIVAVVRNERAAAEVEQRGAEALQGDVTDVAWLTTALGNVDAAIHTAAPSDGAEAFNAAVAEAVTSAFAGSDKRFVLTSGIWLYGSGADLDDDALLDPPELVAWRAPIERRLLESEVSTSIVAPGVVYGRDRGLVNLIADGPRIAADALTLVGDGEQHWTWVHVDDLARLYLLVVEHPTALGRIIGADGEPVTVRDVAEAFAGVSGVVDESAEASRARLGAAFADALLLDQRAHGGKARSLGWVPEHASVLEDLGVEASAA